VQFRYMLATVAPVGALQSRTRFRYLWYTRATCMMRPARLATASSPRAALVGQ